MNQAPVLLTGSGLFCHVKSSVPDAGSGAFLKPGSGSGMGKNLGSDPWIRDGKIQIRDKHPGSATLVKGKLKM